MTAIAAVVAAAVLAIGGTVARDAFDWATFTALAGVAGVAMRGLLR